MSRTIIIGGLLAGWIYLFSGCGGDEPDDSCAGVTCSGHGACVINGGRPMCGCDEGYRPDRNVGLSCLSLDDSGREADPGPAPSWPAGSTLDVSDIGPTSLTLGWLAAVAPEGSAVAGYRVLRDGALYAVIPGQARNLVATGMTQGTSYRFQVQARDEQGRWTTDGPSARASTRAVLPVDPAGLAPTLDRTRVATFFGSTAFLYSGDAPLQVGVEPGAIDPQRAAVLRGIVSARDGGPLAGVTVSVLDHPEFGRTATRQDGAFDLAVSGGLRLTLEYEKGGFLPAQRQVRAPLQDFVWLPDVVLVQRDERVSTIDLARGRNSQMGAALQVARAGKVQDRDGARASTLIFPPGVNADLVFGDGSAEPLERLSFRATEYTEGMSGPAAMPADVPWNVAYTHAVELGVDEAVAGAEVRFDRPVFYYLENFLDFPVGMTVPSGYHDRGLGAWIPSDNGKVIRVLGVEHGRALVDLEGRGEAADEAALEALGFSDAELERLADEYTPGQSLWRVPLTHFTPWDCNWPAGPPGNAQAPQTMVAQQDETEEPCEVAGSIIEPQNQTLGEQIPVAGTGLFLAYRSDRVPGRRDRYGLSVPLGDELPGSPRAILIEVFVAGQRVQERLPAEPGQVYRYTWNGEDAYGRRVQGARPVTVRVGYEYDAVYYAPAEFEQAFGALSGVPITGSPAREAVTLWRSWTGSLGTWDARGQGLGGWSLSVHHALDPSGLLYLGNGRRRRIDLGAGRYAIASVQQDENDLYLHSSSSGVVVGLDGSVYVAETERNRVVRIAGDGSVVTVAGDGHAGYDGDGGPAVEAQLDRPAGLALAADGSLLIADSGNHCIRRVTPGGRIITVAGSGSRCEPSVDPGCGDNGPAVEAELSFPLGVAVGPDGALMIADTGNHRVRRMAPDGTISSVAGKAGGSCCGVHAGAGCDVPAVERCVCEEDPFCCSGTWSADCVYLVNALGCGSCGAGDCCVERDTPGCGDPLVETRVCDVEEYCCDEDGGAWDWRCVELVEELGAGTCAEQEYGDGNLAGESRIAFPTDLAVGPDGSVYFTEIGMSTGLFDGLLGDIPRNRVRVIRPDGVLTTLAGTGQSCEDGPDPERCGDGGAAIGAQLSSPQGLAVGPAGSLFVADTQGHRIRHVGSAGTIATLAGTGRLCGVFADPSCGDKGKAREADLMLPRDVAMGPRGELYVLDCLASCRLRKLIPETPAGEIRIPARDGNELYLFEAGGRHLETRNAVTGALRHRILRDDQGFVVGVEDRDGNVVTIERDAAGVPLAIVAPHGQRTRLELDGEGFLAAVENPAGERHELTYSDKGMLERLVDPRGGVHHFEYDEVGRLVRDSDPAGGAKALSRTESSTGYEVELVTAEGRVSRYESLGLPGQARSLVNTAPGGRSAAAMIGADGSRTLTHADGTVVNESLAADPRWDMLAPVLNSLSISTPGGLAFELGTEREAAPVGPDPALHGFDFRETATVNGRPYIREYNAEQRLWSITSPEGRERFVQLDDLGRAAQSWIEGLAPVQLEFDAFGRVETVTRGAGADTRRIRLEYDDEGNLERLIGPLGHVLLLEHDAAGRIAALVRPDAEAVLLEHDAGGNPVSLFPPGSQEHRLTYSAMNLEQSYQPPGGPTRATSYGYNLDHQRVVEIRPDGTRISFLHDADSGALSAVSFPSGRIEITRDPLTGRRTRIDGPDEISLLLSHDGRLLTSETWQGPIHGVVTHTHDRDFRRASTSVNNQEPVELEYDGDGLLVRAGELSLDRYAATGLVTELALGSTRSAIEHNRFGEPVARVHSAGGRELAALRYERDGLGRIVELDEIVQGERATYEYEYDDAGRLVRVVRDGADVVERYEYDANGNRTLFEDGAGTVVRAWYDEQDRLVEYGDAAFGYGANGELRRRQDNGQVTSYEYDALGNLRSVILPGGTEIEYEVDGLGRRVGKRVNGVLAQGLLYSDALNPVAELDGSGTVVSRFVYAGRSNVPDFMVRDGITYRIISDHLGSPRLVVDASSGGVIQRMDYDAFGRVLRDTNPGFQPFGFAGGIYDPDTGLVRFGRRDYDPTVGRWTAKDPIRFAGGDTNLYAYVFNDPVNLIDPSGLDASGGVDEGVAVLGTIGGLLGGIAKALGSAVLAKGAGVIGVGAASYTAVRYLDEALGNPISGTVGDALFEGFGDKACMDVLQEECEMTPGGDCVKRYRRICF